MKHPNVIYRAIALCLGSVLLFTGCGSSTDSSSVSTEEFSTSNLALYSAADASSDSYDESASISEDTYDSDDSDYNTDYDSSDADYDSGDTNQDVTEEYDTSSSDTKVVSLSEDKIIYSADINLETLTYDDSVSALEELIAQYEGVTEYKYEYNDNYNWYYDDSSDIDNRTLNLTVRIPTASYSDFLDALEQVGSELSRTENAENITKSYSDTQASIEMLETEEARLVTLMEQAETVTDLLAIEERLTEVQTSLAQYRASLNDMDTDLAYSTITITLSEVTELTEQEAGGIGTRFKEALINSWSNLGNFFINLGIALIYAIPFILVILVVILVIWFIHKKRKSTK